MSWTTGHARTSGRSLAFRSQEGRTFCVLRNREGVYLFDGEENGVSFLPKLNAAYFLVGGAEWPEWVRSPA